jgi:hypothetical protein
MSAQPPQSGPTKGANTFTSKHQDGDTEVALYPDRSDPVRRPRKATTAGHRNLIASPKSILSTNQPNSPSGFQRISGSHSV